jgi:cell division protein FtsB
MWEKHRVMRLVILALLLYALVSFAAARQELERQRADTALLEQKRQGLLAEQEELKRRLQAADDPAQMRRLAWEKLRLVSPDETVFLFTQPNA